MMVPWWRPQSYYDEPGRGVLARDGGGVLMTQAIHSLDLFRWLVGIERVEAAQVRTTTLHQMETGQRSLSPHGTLTRRASEALVCAAGWCG